ncbi:MAG: hypothetical protein SFX73_10105 [Kofleriaceae bacterium]|nr:hypothetical protein [Kofleriaceae bacterium]
MLLLVAGCEKSKPSDPPAPTGSGSAAVCPPYVDDYVKQAMDATDVYFSKLSATMKPWTDATSCEAIKAALDPLGADGDAYVKVVESAKAWAKDLSEECRDSLDSKWAGERAQLMEQKFRAIVDGGLGHVQRCENAPGVKDAASRALRLMRKRK